MAGRQTEDELSPTCVPFYQGDNGGATYQGVDAREVRVLIYFDSWPDNNTSQGRSTPPVDTIIDVDAPAKPREHPTISVNRSWQKYFFRRYAAYNRKVHLFLQFSSWTADNSSGEPNREAEQADAAEGYAVVRPFAVLNYATGAGFNNAEYYNAYMRKRGVMVFGALPGHSNDYFASRSGLAWGYHPTLEYSAAQYADAACSILKDKPADGMGLGTRGPAQNGQPRTYGLVYSRDPDWPGTTAQALIAERLMKSTCGITPAIRLSYESNGATVDNRRDQQDYADSIALQLQRAGVTTVLWPAGHETKISQAMARLPYYPEIIAGDDDLQASIVGGYYQDQTVWGQAWVITSQTYDPPPPERICTQAFRSVDQQAPTADVDQFACQYYVSLRQLHTAIQAAGPRLSPASLDQGMHAIPRVESTNPQLPTCFYLVNDYNCVKDSAIMHWDPLATPATQTQPGCWRMVGSGSRFLPGAFPARTNLIKLRHAGHVCNNFRVNQHLMYLS